LDVNEELGKSSALFGIKTLIITGVSAITCRKSRKKLGQKRYVRI